MSVISPTIADVQTVAGVLGGPADVGCLCSDKVYSGGSFVDAIRINPYAFNKPVRKNKFAMLTEADRKLVNYGWAIPEHSSTYGLNSLINAKAAGEKWEYEKPRGINVSYTEPYRIDDFREYDHDTEYPPLLFILEQTQVQQDTQVRMHIRNSELLNTATGIWTWGWGGNGDRTMGNIGLGVFIKNARTVANETHLPWCLLNGYNVLYNMSDIGSEGDKFEVRIPAAFMASYCHEPGIYYITPFLTSVYNADEETKLTTQQVAGLTSSSGNFWPFYGPQLEVEVIAGSVYNPLGSVTAAVHSASGSRANPEYVTLSQIVVRVSNASTDSLNIGGDISITLGQAGYPIEVHASGSAAAGGYVDLTFIIPTGNNKVYDETKGHISLDLTGIKQLANGTITYSNTYDLGAVEDLVFT